jgi:gluconolactonase
MEKSGRANGMIIDPKGNIVACTEERDELWSISKKKKVKVLLTDYEGKRLNGPNDLWMDKKGGIYFTDPYFQRPFWTRKKPDIEKQNVYYLPKGAKQPIPVVTDMQQPNGIVGTPDGRYIYISDMRGNKTYRYQMNKDGSLLDKQLLINQGSDGMTLDEQGNIYLTGRGVTVYNSEGKKIEQINVTPKWTANLCFGGKDRKTLFITASEAVYTLAMQVRGVE